MNNKSLGIALIMATGLFIYGYLLSNAGHDHASHGSDAHSKTTVTESSHGHDNHDHGGDHH